MITLELLSVAAKWIGKIKHYWIGKVFQGLITIQFVADRVSTHWPNDDFWDQVERTAGEALKIRGA